MVENKIPPVAENGGQNHENKPNYIVNSIPNNPIFVKCNVDSIALKAKLKTGIGGWVDRLKVKERITELTVDELRIKLLSGYSCTPGVLEDKNDEGWRQQQVFMCDMDNDADERLARKKTLAANAGKPKEEYITITKDQLLPEERTPLASVEECIQIAESIGLHYSFIYYSFSHKPEHPKFRMVFICSEIITDGAECKRMLEALVSIFPQSDKGCIDLSRGFFPTNKGMYGEFRHVTFDKNVLLEIAPAVEEQPLCNVAQTRPSPSPPGVYGKAELMADCESFDLLQYVLSTEGGRHFRKGNGICVSPCPICGHETENFNITGGKWVCKFTDEGGNIINYLMVRQGMTKQEAAEHFKYKILGRDKVADDKAYWDSQAVTQKSAKPANPDFTAVKWNPDFTMAEWSAAEGERGGQTKHKMTLRKFWQEYPDKNDRPEISIVPKPVMENVECLINHYGIKLKYNIFSECPEVEGRDSNLERQIAEIRDMADKHNFKITKERLTDALVALSWRYKYNPIEDYLKACHAKYDGADHFTQLCNTLTSADTDKALFIKMLLVEMAVMGTCKDNEYDKKSQFIFVLQDGKRGTQGLGKTTWLMNLLPAQFRMDYFLEGRALDLNKTDDVMQNASRWLVEMGEISATFKKSDKELIKAYVTAAQDVFRTPYAKEPIKKKRRMCLCATTNDSEFLRDETGSRRYLVVPCTDIDYNHDVNIDGLWGQVYQMMLDGAKWYFTPEECVTQTLKNETYRVKSDTELALLEYFELNPAIVPTVEGCYTSAQIAAEIKAASTFSDQLKTVSIGKVLNQLNVDYYPLAGNVKGWKVQLHKNSGGTKPAEDSEAEYARQEREAIQAESEPPEQQKLRA